MQGVEALLGTIDALPLRCREALVLHKFDSLSHGEVAARMGISRKAAEPHLRLSLQACRRCRDGNGVAPRGADDKRLPGAASGSPRPA